MKYPILISGCLPPPMGGMATYYQTLLESELSKKINYRFVQTSSNKREFSKNGRASLANFFYAGQDVVRYILAILQTRPQIAHIGTAYGVSFLKHSICVLIARLWGCKVLLHPHCSFITIYLNQSKLWQWFFRHVIRLAEGVIVLSNEWMQLADVVPQCNIYYLPNSIHIQKYQPVFDKKSSFSCHNGMIRLLFLGYLGKAKGSFDIIEAAGILRSRGVKVLINLVGSELSPGEVDRLQERIRSENLEAYLHLNPPAYGDEKLEYFEKTDIFLYPSYHEGVPMAVLEAMACGLPIIASRVGGLPDVIEDGRNGILVEPGQPEQLANAICSLVDQPDILRQMGKASFQIVSEKYGIDRHITQLVDIYQSLL